jgi:hypothetical protein
MRVSSFLLNARKVVQQNPHMYLLVASFSLRSGLSSPDYAVTETDMSAALHICTRHMCFNLICNEHKYVEYLEVPRQALVTYICVV